MDHDVLVVRPLPLYN